MDNTQTENLLNHRARRRGGCGKRVAADTKSVMARKRTLSELYAMKFGYGRATTVAVSSPVVRQCVVCGEPTDGKLFCSDACRRADERERPR
jgi:hypothetical protein